MKTAAAILTCTALAALGGLMFVGKPVSQPVVNPPTEPAARIEFEKAKRLTAAPTAAVSSSEPQPFKWSALESSDYKDYIARLRAINCPEETIRDIIVADVNKLYAPREAALKSKEQVEDNGTDTKAARAARQAEFEKRKQLRDVQREKNTLLKELLGIELPLEPLRARDDRNYESFDLAFNALPAAKREVVREIQENYWQASDALKDKYDNKRTAQYLEEYKKLNLDRKNHLANVLSPEEMEEYEMRTSNVGDNLRSVLAQFSPSEEEFRKIFKIRKGIDEPYVGNLPGGVVEDTNGVVSAASMQSYSDKQKAADAQIKEILGPERAAEFERSQNYDYRRMKDLVERYGLPQDAAVKGYEMQKAVREAQNKVRSDRTLSKEQRDETLKLLKAEGDKALNEIFGPRAAASWQRARSGAQYIDEDLIYVR